ncbi:MAG: hypothetical protein LBI18_11640 [Planctomycetaceae bacterium]|jgi:GTPase SAR1 family protein|nr:hypothetical protein [Planctomycetaceae bacterium]
METTTNSTLKTTPQIAIVGTEGSGKTILASVLVKRMSSNIEEVFLHPRSWETAEYVEKVWNALNNGEWWKSTEAGCTFELQWSLHIGRLTVPMKLIDSAGQDLRELFSKDTYKQKNLSGIQRELLDYIQNASIVILVVNLLHFRGEPDNLKRKQNEFVLKEVIDMFAADPKHQDIAVVFTAWDLYHADITKNYSNFTNYLQKELPLLYNAMRLGHQSGDSIHYFPVAAVMDTELIDNVRVPKPNFRSGGLNTLSDWLINIVQRTQQKERVETQVQEYDLKMQELNQWLIPVVCGIVAGLVGLLGAGIGNAIGCVLIGLILGRVGMLYFAGKFTISGLWQRLSKQYPALSATPKMTTENNEPTETQNTKVKQPKSSKVGKQPTGSRKTKQIDDSYDDLVPAENDDLVPSEDDADTIQSHKRKSKSMKF